MFLRSYLPISRILRHVRPWALSGPIVVLLIAVPLLRPLRHPDPRSICDDEQARLATVQAIVENRTLAIDGTVFSTSRQKVFVGGRHYSDQPPVMALLLSGPYWVMYERGMTFEHNPLWVMFLLTLIGVTLPVALAAGLIYKMGRLFELKRPLRAALGLVVVLGSGLIAYATTLNAHAPAAALLLASAASLFQASQVRPNLSRGAWLGLAGFCAALAATLDPPALIFTVLLILVVGVVRMPVAARVGAVLIYLAGVALPIAVHALLNLPITGDIRPAYLHPELRAQGTEALRPAGRARNMRRSSILGGPNSTVTSSQGVSAAAPSMQTVAAHKPAAQADEEDDDSHTFFQSTWRRAARIASAFFGAHGILSHFPVLIVGIVGTGMVMHRHWHPSTKMLAGVTLGGSLFILLLFALSQIEWRDAMFATRWFVVFLPLLLFWCGAWLRRSHRPIVWAAFGLLLCFSIGVALLGATGPEPRGGFDRYTAAGALSNLVNPPPPEPMPAMLAGG